MYVCSSNKHIYSSTYLLHIILYICIHLNILIYLANGLHKAKIKLKISDTVFHAWRNHQGEVVVVALTGSLSISVYLSICPELISNNQINKTKLTSELY